MSFESAAVARQRVADETGWAVGDPRLALPEGELRARWPAAFPDQAAPLGDPSSRGFDWSTTNVDPDTLQRRGPTQEELQAQTKQPPQRHGYFVDRSGGLRNSHTGFPMIDSRPGTADKGNAGDPPPEWWARENPDLVPTAAD